MAKIQTLTLTNADECGLTELSSIIMGLQHDIATFENSLTL